MDLEQRLREALHDPGWDLPPWPDPETRIRAALRRRRRTIAAAALAVVVAAGLVVVWLFAGRVAAGSPNRSRYSGNSRIAASAG